jgi:ATPase subunit of ABC transporter with duplicated ATPase domains
VYGHPFTRARDLLAADDAAHETKLERDAREAGRLRRNAGQLRNIGINSGSDLLLKKAKYLVNRAEAIEEAARPVTRTRPGEIRLANKGTHAKVLVALDNVSVVSPAGQTLFNTGTLKLFQGDRVVIGGANGTGKSCFVDLLRRAMRDGEPIPGIAVAPSVSAGYLDQRMSMLPPAETPHAFLTSRFRPGDQVAVRLLASAGFDIDTQRRPIEQLSLGQKTRLGLLALRLTEPNFYLMDEPTNHVDIAGQERLEAEILAHAATCLLVSHDRFFVRAIGTRFFRIEGGALVEQDRPEA